MVEIGSKTSRFEKVALLLLFAYVSLTLACMVALDFLRWGIPGKAGRWSFVVLWRSAVAGYYYMCCS